MYENFYNLTKEPFHITPDPLFLYPSNTHKQALAAITYGINKRKGFVAIIGDVGVGKTIVVRAYLEKAALAGMEIIYLFHANVSFEDLVRTIYRELGLQPATTDLIEMVNDLQLALIELYRQGKTVVIVIDEAQSMPLETLENLRMLSNLETATDKLIQVVLVGQSELEGLLEKDELRQLKQRIAIQARIVPLSAQESYGYIEHRLSVAGLDKPTIFSKGALDVIIKEANGIPRRLNVLCDNALITGYGYQKNPVTASIAREVVADFAGKKPRRRSPVRKWKTAAFVGAALFLALLAASYLLWYRPGAVRVAGDAHVGQAAKPESPESAPPVVAEPKAGQAPESATPPASVAEQKRAPSAAPYTTRVVRQGETLYGLIREVYHTSPNSAREDSLISLVKKHNPVIVDPNLILAGSVIRFPVLPEGEGRSR